MRVELEAPQPNPAHGGTRIGWAIPESHAGLAVDLAVFDLAGRRVRTIASGPARPGRFSSSWDLRNVHGEGAAAGVYFVRLQIGSESHTARCVVLR